MASSAQGSSSQGEHLTWKGLSMDEGGGLHNIDNRSFVLLAASLSSSILETLYFMCYQTNATIATNRNWADT